MRVLFFGTYDTRAHPRVQVLKDGLREHGSTVAELNAPLGLSTAQRVQILRQPWRLPVLVGRLVRSWSRLVLGSREFRRRGVRPGAVVVGYLGHFDVLLARLVFGRSRIVLDHLIFAADTAADRGTGPGLRTRLLAGLDRLAISSARLVVVDTDEHRELMPPSRRADTVVVPVGATSGWFAAGTREAAKTTEQPDAAPVRGPSAPLSVVFFGLFTPLQGASVIGAALRLVHEHGIRVEATLIGSGQDADAVREHVDGLPEVTWYTWVEGADLPIIVAAHDVCLGIFGVTAKARRVVPNKVFQGAAAGTAIVTSDTAPQRRSLGDAAVFVGPGDPTSLADALERLATDEDHLAQMRRRARDLAERSFTPQAVTAALHDRLRAWTAG